MGKNPVCGRKWLAERRPSRPPRKTTRFSLSIYIGKEVNVLLANGKRKTGVILSYDGILIMEVVKKKKGSRKIYIKEQVKILKEEIKETKLKINFK